MVVENNDKDPKHEVGDHVKVSKYKNTFAKIYKLKKVKNTVLWIYALEGLNGEEVVRMFYEKELRKDKSIRIAKVKKEKYDSEVIREVKRLW